MRSRPFRVSGSFGTDNERRRTAPVRRRCGVVVGCCACANLGPSHARDTPERQALSPSTISLSVAEGRITAETFSGTGQ